MAKDIPTAVREVCLSFPEAEEYLSHGSPNFRVRGMSISTYRNPWETTKQREKRWTKSAE